MRLPWPFGRSTSADGASSTSGDDAGSGAPAGPASPPAPAPIPPTGAWRTLPPIQRTAGPPPVVAPAAPFLAHVPGHAPLPPIVTPLGHDSSPAAPAGIVVAHPHTVPEPDLGRAAHEPAGAAARDHDRAGRRGVHPTRPEEAAPVVSRVAESTGRQRRAESTSPPPEPELPPIRTVAPVTPAATVTPSPRPLTQASSTLAPLPLSAPRAPGATGDPGRTSRPASLALPIQASGRIPASAPRATDAPDATRPAQAPLRRFAELPAETPRPAAQRQAGGAPRRAGLGAPMSVPPASATAQRMPVAPALTSVPSFGLQPTSAAPVAAPEPADAHRSHEPVPVAPVAPRPLPVLEVARQRRDAPTTGVPGTVTPAATGPARSTSPTTRATTVARSATTVLPTVGARPLRPSGSAGSQGADRPAATAAGGPATTDDGPAPVLARWDSGETLPATVTSLPTAPAAERGLPVQLSPIEAASTGSQAPRQAQPASREIVFPPRDARTEPAIGDAGGWPAALGLPVLPGPSAAHQASAARPAPTPLTLARSVAPAPAPTPTPAPSAATPVVARIVADPASPGAPPVIQTSPAGGGIPVATFTATPIVQREETAAPAAPPEQAARSDRELDELAKQLFGRIRGQLKSEVIHEREAKGLTFDAF